MTRLLTACAAATLAGAPAPAPVAAQAAADSAAAAAVLDDFHRAASAADGERYFAHFASGGVFLGTDASERWTVDEFRAYARPYFSAGRGWTYVPTVRRIVVGPDGRSAWFDELLENASYGTTRGSGMLLKEEGRWKIAIYDLSIPIPNPLAGHVAGLIADHEAAEEDGQAEVSVRLALEAYYDAFSDRDWPRFEASFWPGATLTTAWQPPGEDEPRVDATTVPEFVARAPEGPGSREIFEERMLSADVRVRGDLATAWVRYRARFGDPGDVMEWEGTDVITLMRHGAEWRITGLAYASEGG
ncbi:MAG: nuclear transport factor 2 family protein [Gemmatimonadetes bacterium]|nr:nuclear transport factor 2 family protein [Gemmatimonadota bacterium]